MRTSSCLCGQRLFFDNTSCVRCGRQLGFDPAHGQLVTLLPAADGTVEDPHGQRFRHCRNRTEYGACNWLVPANGAAAYCQSCRLNMIIPNLAAPGNLALWIKLEQAKRRLIYTLLALQLPLGPTGDLPGLSFRFLEDQQRNPAVAEDFVATGHAAGVITINVAEADDMSRALVRAQMQERYRTLLGHFRHECGHYYFSYLVSDPDTLARYRQLFGDELSPYEEALGRYYSQGPPPDWPDRWVSAYAAAHPVEDWAESFAHYLHIVDAMETAHDFGLTPIAVQPGDEWIGAWGSLSVKLNEINRSLGLDDPYPFVLPAPVLQRLRFIHQQVGHAAAA